MNLPQVTTSKAWRTMPCSCGRNRVVESQYPKYSFHRGTISRLQESVPVGEEDSLPDRSALPLKSTSGLIPELLGATQWQSLLERPESSAHQAFSTCPSRDLQGRPSPNILLRAGESAQKWDLSDWARLLALKKLDDYNSQLSSQNLLAECKVYMHAVDLDRPSLPCGLRCVPFFQGSE